MDSSRVGVPEEAFYQEPLNTDAALTGGSNVGNMGGVPADKVPQSSRTFSLYLTLPPLGALAFRRTPVPQPEEPVGNQNHQDSRTTKLIIS